MRRASASLALTLFVAATIFGLVAGARQRPPTQPSEASRLARAKMERQIEEENRIAEEANARARAEEEKIFQATRQERADFDRKMDDFADKHSKDAGTHVTLVQSVGENGLPERGEVWFVRKGFITDRAEFDASGNTTGLVETPTGRALRSYEAHRPQGVEVTSSYSFTNGADGRTQIRSVEYTGPDGVRGEMRFNQDGVAYYGEFFTGGRRTGGFYDPRLEWRDPPPRALEAPALVRPVTQPCEPCRAAAEAYNDLVRQMAPTQNKMASLARENGVTGPGYRRQAIETEFDALKATWDALEPQLEAARAKLRACQSACMQPSGNLANATGNGATLAGITVRPSNVIVSLDTITAGLNARVVAMGTFSDGSVRDVTTQASWTTSTPDVVSVSEAGLIAASGRMPGVGTITASIGTFSDDASVTLVDATLQSITVEPPTFDTLPAGVPLQFTAMGLFSDGNSYDITEDATWSSANTAIATVSSRGELTNAAPGTVSVTATLGAISDDLSITIPESGVTCTGGGCTFGNPPPIMCVGAQCTAAATPPSCELTNTCQFADPPCPVWQTCTSANAAGAPIVATPETVGTTAREVAYSGNAADRAFWKALLSDNVLLTMYAEITRVTSADGSVSYHVTGDGYNQTYDNLTYVVEPNGRVQKPAAMLGGLREAANALVESDIRSQPGWDSPVTNPTQPDLSGTYTVYRPTVVPPNGDSTALPGGDPRALNFDDLSAFDQIGGTSPGDRDPSVQYMIVEVVILKAAQIESQIDRMAGAARTLWDVLRGVATASTAFAARDGAYSAARPAMWQQANRPAGGGRVQTLLTSLGTSTGEAFEIQVAGDGKTPVNIGGNGVVVEPLKRAVAQQARQQIGRLASRNPVTQKLDAYCIEFLRQPPSAGTIFRVASPELQKKFAPMRRVLQASQQVQQSGLVKPDSDPKAYFSAIKQWALWSRERNFDEKSYGDAFVEHTKKNAKEAGVQWTREIEGGIRSLVPGRWTTITRILQAADEIR